MTNRISVSLDGYVNMILEKAVSLGIAKTKNEAIRLGILSLNREYKLNNKKCSPYKITSSESAFAKDWLTEEEDTAWKNL